VTGSQHSFTFADVLREQRRSRPSKTAVVCGGSRWSYPELDERSSRLASLLRERGLGAGGRLLWLGQNCHRAIESLFAAAKLGAIFCPANWRGSAEEIAFVIGDLSPTVVLWQAEEIGPAVERARAISNSPASFIQHDGDYDTLLAGASALDPEDAVDPNAALLAMYTAAFSGRPSAALLSHQSLLIQSLVAARLKDIDAAAVYLVTGPLFHMAALVPTAATLVAGGTDVIARRPDPEEICGLIERERCTGAMLTPTTIQQLVALNREGRFDLESLRSYAASPEWAAMVTIDDSPSAKSPGGYGQTECGGHLTFNALALEQRGGAGRPMPWTQVRIVDPGSGRELPPGEVGEIVARGPTMMSGYFGREQDSVARTTGGWHHTRDLGRRESDGSIRFVGPMTRLIKSAAENIYPVEVEAALKQHSAVKDCAVIGVPDATWGQSVKAIVVLAPGSAAGPEELIEHVRAKIASYKKPRTIEFVDELPRMGHAVDYEALDRRFGGGGYPGSPVS
jgi:long-chain acyl-CoA synthetase